MRLPAELRLHIFSFLLPDLKSIYPVFRWCCPFRPGSRKDGYGYWRYRSDFDAANMAIMRSNRQTYDEVSSYLYNRSTIVVIVRASGVNLLKSHWGCGRLRARSLIDIPFDKFKLVWLQIEAPFDLRKHLVHVRRNLLSFCTALCQTDSPKCLRVDLFDACHRDESKSLESIHVQGGVKIVTEGIESLIDRSWGCTKEITENQIWRAANSTGISLAATDVEVILQPLKLLRGVQRCQIFLTPHLQRDNSLADLTALHEEIVRSKRDITLTDLTSVQNVSEVLYNLAAFNQDEKFISFHHKGQKRMERLLWQTRKWHRLPCDLLRSVVPIGPVTNL